MSGEDHDVDTHGLAPFLKERLPSVGLDYETYGPYVLPLLLADDESPDDDEWESVMQLLQASSETHSDDDSLWVMLRKDIELAWKSHRDQVVQEEAAAALEQKLRLQEQIELDKQMVQDAAAMKIEPVKHNVDDAEKKSLMARFGYEDPNELGGASDEEGAPITNREVAKQMDVERSQALRDHKRVTKREEQQKTADAKKSKANLKEERRKRATKGERKR